MSDADDSGFDKEAERERLREKYEHEQADREVAQQMSDLLLKGATMTNSHCGQCGSPIFRVDGQEFCPSCNAEGEAAADAVGTAETAADAGGAAEEGTDADGAPEARSGAGDPTPDERLVDAVSSDVDGDATAGTAGGTSMAERAAASVRSGQRGSREPPGGAGDEAEGGAAGRADGPDPAPEARPSSAPAGRDAGANASLADAQQSLLDAIDHHARAATGAEPRTARDHLEAASEAAEALAEISQ